MSNTPYVNARVYFLQSAREGIQYPYDMDFVPTNSRTERHGLDISSSSAIFLALRTACRSRWSTICSAFENGGRRGSCQPFFVIEYHRETRTCISLVSRAISRIKILTSIVSCSPLILLNHRIKLLPTPAVVPNGNAFLIKIILVPSIGLQRAPIFFNEIFQLLPHGLPEPQHQYHRALELHVE